jgi:hypothetical protein
MMSDMMNGGMMWGMGHGWLLAFVVLVLAAAALVKYLLFQRSSATRPRAMTLSRALPRSNACSGNAMRSRAYPPATVRRYSRRYFGLTEPRALLCRVGVSAVR